MNLTHCNHVYKFRRSREKKQDNISQSSTIVAAVAQSIEQYFRNLPLYARKVFDYLLHLYNRYGIARPTQATIAAVAGVSRKTVSMVLSQFEADGLITSAYRHMTSCYYRIASFFFNPSIQSRLSPILKAFRYLSLSLLMTSNIIQSHVNRSVQSEYVTRLSYKAIRNLITSNKSRPGELAMKKFLQVMHQDNPISPLIRSLKHLKLTKWGQIVLSAFPDEAIAAAQERYAKAPEVRDTFSYFIKGCWDYCNLHEIEPDWSWSTQLAKHYGMPRDAQYIQETPLVEKDLEAQPRYDKGTFDRLGTTVQPKIFKEPKTGTTKNTYTKEHGSVTTTAADRAALIAKQEQEKQKVLQERHFGNRNETELEKYMNYQNYVNSLDRNSFEYTLAVITLSNWAKP